MEKLSDALNKVENTYAICSYCHKIFIDDIAQIHSIECPSCKMVCLQRGVSQGEIISEKRK